MKHASKYFMVAILSAAFISLLSSPAFALSGSDDIQPTATPTATVKPTATPTIKPTVSPTIKKAVEIEKRLSESDINTRVNSMNTKAQEAVKQLQTKKEAAKQHTEQERQKACTTRSAELTEKLNKKIADAEKYKAVFDKIYTAVKNLHDTKQLNTPDYDALVAKVNAAQQAATDAIATLKGFNTTVNCGDVNAVATKVVAFKDALSQTRDALKAYRTAIKNLNVAIRASIVESKPTSTPSVTPTPTNTLGN